MCVRGATSSAFSAEYGRATGGVINVTTKSGTNEFHGTLFHFFRNDALNAANFFSNRSGLPKTQLRHNQFGGNIGGPILKNRLFFFFNYEGAQVVRGQVVQGNVPTDLLVGQIANPSLRAAYAATPRDYRATGDPLIGFHERNDTLRNDENTYVTRIDYHASRHHIAGRWNYNNQDFRQPLFIRDTFLPYPTRFRNMGFQDNFTISSNKLNEFRFGYNSNELDRFSSDLREDPRFPGSQGAAITSVATAPGLAATGRQDRILFKSHTWTAADNFSWILSQHSIKAGVEVRRLHTQRIIEQNPFINYNSIADMVADRAQRVDVSFGVPPVPIENWNTGFYFQDDWRVNRRIQINAGLRYEYYTPLTGPFNVVSDPFGPFAPKGTPIFNRDMNNFAPRLGLVVDLLGDGSTILRTGAGIGYVPIQPFFYYDMAFLDGPLPFLSPFFSADLPSSTPLTFPFPLSFQEQVISNPSLLPKDLKIGRSITDRNSRTEYSGQWNLALQRKITNTLAVQAAYVGSRGLKLYNGRELNLINPATGQRIQPELGSVLYRENGSRSSYHGLQLSVNQRLAGGFTFDFNYTYAKALQYGNADGAYVGDGNTQDLNNIADSYGPKQSDTRHRIVTVWSYLIPSPAFARQSAFGKAVFGGWNVDGIYNYRTGYPINVMLGRDAVGNGRAAGQRPDLVSGIDPLASTSDPLVWLNRAAFDAATPAAERRFGNLGYNALYGPGALWLDMSIHKLFSITERQNLQFRFEMFNALNHVVYGQPDTSLSSANFGRIVNGNDGRSIQLALKYRF